MTKPIDLAGFEALFRSTIDPWDYRGSRFEERKRRILIRACGSAKVARGLELACAIGETSRALATRTMRLVATDGAPTALAEARRRTDPAARIDYRQAVLPRDLPRGPFDLVVVSEIAYYLGERDLALLARGLLRALAPGGRIVVLHHLVRFADAAQLPVLAQERLCRALAGRCVALGCHRHGRYEVAAFRKPLAAPRTARRRRCRVAPAT